VLLPPRPLPSLLLGLAGGLVLLVGPGVAPASAHTELVDTAPGDGTILSRPPTAVGLTFDEPVQAQGATIVVAAADGTKVTSGTAVVAASTVKTAIESLPAAGKYTVAYRVVSDDGHPVVGEFAFTARASATSQMTNTAAVLPGGAADHQGTWMSQQGLLALGGVVLVGGLALLVRERRQRG
jgi:copper resistance protein C